MLRAALCQDTNSHLAAALLETIHWRKVIAFSIPPSLSTSEPNIFASFAVAWDSLSVVGILKHLPSLQSLIVIPIKMATILAD